MKQIIGLALMAFLIGCAPLSDVRERDMQIAELREQMSRDKIVSDSLLSQYAADLTTEQNRYTSASYNRDRWFREFSSSVRANDTLYMRLSELEENLSECNIK